jgi:hypothetical protein
MYNHNHQSSQPVRMMEIAIRNPYSLAKRCPRIERSKELQSAHCRSEWFPFECNKSNLVRYRTVLHQRRRSSAAPIHRYTPLVRRGTFGGEFGNSQSVTSLTCSFMSWNWAWNWGTNLGNADSRWTSDSRSSQEASQWPRKLRVKDPLQSQGQHALAALRCQTSEVCPFVA